MNNLKTIPIIHIDKRHFELKVIQDSLKMRWRKLAIATMDEVRFIPFEEIIYCMSTSNYTTVFLRSGKSYLCTKTLKDISSRLPAEMFIRIHDSYLVNMHSITSLKKQTSEIEIENKLSLPVSRTHRKELYQILGL